jgi:hypothetical protein
MTGLAADGSSVSGFPETVIEDKLHLLSATYSDSSVKISLLLSCEINI